MKRRLYFLLPNTVHTRAVVNDLQAFDINRKAMHVLAKPDIDLNELHINRIT